MLRLVVPSLAVFYDSMERTKKQKTSRPWASHWTHEIRISEALRVCTGILTKLPDVTTYSEGGIATAHAVRLDMSTACLPRWGA